MKLSTIPYPGRRITWSPASKKAYIQRQAIFEAIRDAGSDGITHNDLADEIAIKPNNLERSIGSLRTELLEDKDCPVRIKTIIHRKRALRRYQMVDRQRHAS